MSQTAPDDLDALLASLMHAAPSAEPVSAMPVISPERAASLEHLRAWLVKHLSNAQRDPNWQPEPDPGYEVAALEPVQPIDPEIVAELAAARARYDGDPIAFDAALARLPSHRAEHHRRMAAVCDLMKVPQAARAQTATPGGRS